MERGEEGVNTVNFKFALFNTHLIPEPCLTQTLWEWRGECRVVSRLGKEETKF